MLEGHCFKNKTDDTIRVQVYEDRGDELACLLGMQFGSRWIFAENRQALIRKDDLERDYTEIKSLDE